MSIPSGPEDLTAAWFEEITDWTIDSVRAEQIGVGVGVSGALYRVHLAGSGSPASVVVKLPALDPLAHGTAVALGLYKREVAFYGELAADCPVTTPTCFHHDIDDEGDQFVVVMEDRSDARVIDQVAGVELADAERIVERLADWHGTWWNDTDGLIERGIAVPVGSPMYPATLPTLFAEGWERLSTDMPHVLDGLHEIAERYPSALAPSLQTLDQAPVTLLHGDFRADNMLFAPDDDLVVLDFQILGSGAPAYDLAYFVTQSLDAELVSEHERALFDRWLARLQEHQPDADLSGEWDRYRLASLFCITIPVTASRGMDTDDPRQRALLEVMMSRISRACRDLDLVELWR